MHHLILILIQIQVDIVVFIQFNSIQFNLLFSIRFVLFHFILIFIYLLSVDIYFSFLFFFSQSIFRRSTRTGSNQYTFVIQHNHIISYHISKQHQHQAHTPFSFHLISVESSSTSMSLPPTMILVHQLVHTCHCRRRHNYSKPYCI